MFKKLLSNLPFNPSLITEVSFYAKRLKKESSVRRVGFVFMALTLVVQVFAVITPAEASNKCSSNDVIRCGFSSKNEAVQKCNANTQGFRSILEYYGINCGTLSSAGTQTVRSSAYNGQLYSMGRNPYSKPGEYRKDIPGVGGMYLRPLSSWGSTSYKMLVTKTPDGMPFMVMYDCGNIVIQNGYNPPAKPEPTATLKIVKANEPTGEVKPGDTIKYTIAFTNTGGTAALFSVNDTLDDNLEFVSSNSNGWPEERGGQYTKWYNNTPPYYTFGNTDAFGTPGFITITARVKSSVKSGTVVCNTAWLGHYVNGQPQTTNKVSACNDVIVPCPPGTIAGPGGTCDKPEEPKPEKPKPEEPKPEKPKPEEKAPILAVEKKAKNITQNIADANNTTASAGDVIEYSLITKNFGNGESKDTILKPEELADILEYADLDFNSLNGAIFEQETQTIAWNKPVTIKPNESVTKTFRIKVKNPLPQTPVPNGNPGSFDLIMTNVYGNTINIKLPGGVVKSTEQVTQTLPNTGPGEALAIGGVLITIIGYFFARSRLMAKELELVKQEYSSGS
jgi:uncharacterized repeat protein (TIGR01451 family)